MDGQKQKSSKAHDVLAFIALGDALGYRGGQWEFCKDAATLVGSCNQIVTRYDFCAAIRSHQLKLDDDEWRVSDDTLMTMATCVAMHRIVRIERITGARFEDMIRIFCDEYVRAMELPSMKRRGPGNQCIQALELARKGVAQPYSAKAGGCGAAMRTAPIGFMYAGSSDIATIVKLCYASAIVTHNHGTAILGALANAAFTKYALEHVPCADWFDRFFAEFVPEQEKQAKAFGYELGPGWERSLRLFRLYNDDMTAGKLPPWYPSTADETTMADLIRAHDAQFLQQYAYGGAKGWAGSSGDDAIIFAHQALMVARGDLNQLIVRSALHPGDSDTTAALALGWFAAQSPLALDQLTSRLECDYQLWRCAALMDMSCNRVLFASACKLVAQYNPKMVLMDAEGDCRIGTVLCVGHFKDHTATHVFEMAGNTGFTYSANGNALAKRAPNDPSQHTPEVFYDAVTLTAHHVWALMS